MRLGARSRARPARNVRASHAALWGAKGRPTGPRSPEPPMSRPAWMDTPQQGSVKNACPLLLVISILALQETRTQVVSLVTGKGVHTQRGTGPAADHVRGATRQAQQARRWPAPAHTHGRAVSGFPQRGLSQLCHLSPSLGPLGPRPRTMCLALCRPPDSVRLSGDTRPWKCSRACLVTAVPQACGGSDTMGTRGPPGHEARRP